MLVGDAESLGAIREHAHAHFTAVTVAAPGSARGLVAAVSSGASSLVSISDADGLATVTAVANASAGSYAVAASVDGAAPQVFNLTNLPAVVATPPVPAPALADSALVLLALTLVTSAFWGLSRR